MTREEAIERVRTRFDKWALDNEDLTALQALAPELAESDDERVRRWIKKELEDKYVVEGIVNNKLADEAFGWLEKQKHLYETTKDRFYREGFEEGQLYERQKEQEPIKAEVYEVGKGTTVCGQDYKCKKDYQAGNCRYIKDAIYHCGRDGYLTDQNGVSWSCTPEWFNEYIQSNTEWAEEEKTRFVSGQFLQCKLSFDGFKEGEHYWLEYVGDDMYVGRSDNILNQKFHITPRQLYTLFSQKLDKAQEPPKKEEQVSSEYETPMFEETPSDKQIIDALIHHLNEQDGFLTAINCVSTKAILSWLKKQQEQKPLTMESAYEKFVNPETLKEARTNKYIKAQLLWELMHNGIITEVDYQYLTDDKRKPWTVEEYRIAYQKGFDMSEQLKQKERNPAEWDELQSEFKNINEAFEDGKKEVVAHPERYGLCECVPAEWDEEDRDTLLMAATVLKANFDSDEKFEDCDYDCGTLAGKLLGMRYRISPSWKPSEEQMEALKEAAEHSFYAGEGATLRTLYNDLQKRYGTC